MAILEQEAAVPAVPASLESESLRRLDFTMVRLKLRDSEEGPGWSEEEADAAEQEYRRFLALKLAYPDREIVPNKIVDQFWHQHILDTRQYAEDCDQVFGQFLHHFPYFGMRDEADAQDLKSAFEETCRLYRQHFGESYSRTESRARCRTGCKPQKCK
jgi:hypothetical protein